MDLTLRSTVKILLFELILLIIYFPQKNTSFFPRVMVFVGLVDVRNGGVGWRTVKENNKVCVRGGGAL